MRRLLLTRGAPASGKSTLLRERLELDAYRLSSDELRLTLAGPELLADGTFGISQRHDDRVWPLLMELLEARMARGELVVVDATHSTGDRIAPYVRSAERHRYRVACLDLSTVPLRVCLARNAGRPALRRVPQAALRRIHAECLGGRVPEGVERYLLDWDGGAEDALAAAIDDWLAVPIEELTGQVSRIHHLGGSSPAALEAYLAAHPPRDGALHLLVDDLPAPPEVRALPADEPFAYRFHGHRVLVTRAGLTTVPPRLERVSGRTLREGPEALDVDARFDEQAPGGWVQVHGLRNPEGLPVRAAPRSFNLAGDALRVAVLEPEGWRTAVDEG